MRIQNTKTVVLDIDYLKRRLTNVKNILSETRLILKSHDQDDEILNNVAANINVCEQELKQLIKTINKQKQ